MRLSRKLVAIIQLQQNKTQIKEDAPVLEQNLNKVINKTVRVFKIKDILRSYDFNTKKMFLSHSHYF